MRKRPGQLWRGAVSGAAGMRSQAPSGVANGLSTRPVDTRQMVGCWRVSATSKSADCHCWVQTLPGTGSHAPGDPGAALGTEQKLPVVEQMPSAWTYSQCAYACSFRVLVRLISVSRVPSAITFGQSTTDPGLSEDTPAWACVPQSAMAASTTPRPFSHGLRFCTRIACLLSVTAPIASGFGLLTSTASRLISICCLPVKRKTDH